MATRNYHRGDVFTVQANPSWEYPDGQTFPIMIIQNDAGEIPCDTVTAVRLKPSRNAHKKGWLLHDRKIRRFDKRQLMSYMGNLPATKSEKLISQVESQYGFHVPFVLDTP